MVFEFYNGVTNCNFFLDIPDLLKLMLETNIKEANIPIGQILP